MSDPTPPAAMSEAELDAIEARANAATSGEWTLVHVTGDDDYVVDMGFKENSDLPDSSRMQRADAVFIAHARTDIPRLLAEVRRLRTPQPPAAEVREKMFPIQREYHKDKPPEPYPMLIPWSIAELAYSVYASRYGTSQSLETLANRGGFGPSEMDMFLPTWRERCDKLTTVTLERDRLAVYLRKAREALAELQPWAAERERWISIDERLPERGHDVWWAFEEPITGEMAIQIGHIRVDGMVGFSHDHPRPLKEHTHWMPLPAPPLAARAEKGESAT